MMKPVSFLRKVSMAEGISYLVLLLVAMPLKYWADMPMAVRVVGSLHGLLFVVLCVALLRVLIQARWPFFRAVLVFVLSFVPLAPLFLDRRMKEWEGEVRG
jgi:integral membrane protein